MKIAVLIKQVPVSDQVSVDPVTHALRRESSEGMVNPVDLNAVEMALLLREAVGGTVTAVTMGPADARKALEEVMARGCDDGVLVTDRCLAGGDTVATAKVLARTTEKCGGFDVILCGAQSSDGATGQVGAMTAEILSIPHAAEIQNLSAGETEGTLKAVKKYKDELITLECSLPALFTVSFGCNEPRLSTLRSRRAAKAKPVAVYTNQELQFLPEEVGLMGSPTKTVDTFEPSTAKKAVIFHGTGKELAEKLRELLEKGNE